MLRQRRRMTVSAETMRGPGVVSQGEAAPVTLLYLIKQVELAIRSRLDALVTQHGITITQYTAMTVLERHPGTISAQLARGSFVRAQSMAQLVDTLEVRGLVERRRDSSSRRHLLISLTPAGRRLAERARATIEALDETALAALDPRERATLMALIAKISGSLDVGVEETSLRADADREASPRSP